MQGESQSIPLIGRIYDAALEPRCWDRALKDCTDLLSGAAFQLYTIDRESRALLFQVDHGLPERFSNGYREHFSRESERNAIFLNNPDIAFGYDYMFFDERELDTHHGYHWRAQFDFRYYIGGPLFHTETEMAFAALQRSPKQGHVADRQIALYRTLRPHLARAVQIQNRIAGLELSDRSAWEVIEGAIFGIVVLGPDRRIRRCNREARRILAEEAGLSSTPDGLKAKRPIDDRSLQQLISQAVATSDGTGHGGGGSIAVAKRGGDRPYSVLATPISAHLELAALEQCGVVLFLSDPDRTPSTPVELLRRHYGLSRKEVAIVTPLIAGATLAESAALCGIAEGTARRHLASIFTKTSLHRQADLVRLVLSLPPADALADH